MRKWRIAFLVATLTVTGCADQRILERIGFTQVISYDMTPDGDLRTVISVPKSGSDRNTQRLILKTTTSSSKQARIQLSRQTDLQLVSGQLHDVIIGTSMARNGIWNAIDTLIRDPAIPSRVKISVVKGDAGQLLSKDYEQHPTTGKYISHLLEKESRGHSITSVTLYQFTRDYYDDGIDPVVPILKDVGEHIAVEGIGLFVEDKFVGSLTAGQSLMFAMLRMRFKQGDLSIQLGEAPQGKKTVMFSSLISSRSIQVNKGEDPGSFRVNIDIRLKGSILEYIGELKISDRSDRHKLETTIASYIENECNEIVRQMQELGADSIGLGAHIRNSMSYAAWKRLNWREAYPRVKVNCKVKVTIKDYGKFK